MRVGKRAQSIVVLLSGCVEETECVGFVTDPEHAKSALVLFCVESVQRGHHVVAERCDIIAVIRLPNAVPINSYRGRSSIENRNWNSHNSHRIVVEDRGHVFRRELVGSVGDQEAGFSNSTVTNHHAPNGSNLSIRL